MLVEGVSVRSFERPVSVHRDTILSILVVAGERYERLLEEKIHAIPVKDVQCDEILGFAGCEQKRNVNDDPRLGDAYCLVAMERNKKLILSWHLGRRTARDTVAFTEKINEATAGQFQTTKDGSRPYVDAVQYSLGTRVYFGQLVKVYGASGEGEHRYSPAEVMDAVPVPQWGKPDPRKICTSQIENRNLQIRMAIRILT